MFSTSLGRELHANAGGGVLAEKVGITDIASDLRRAAVPGLVQGTGFKAGGKRCRLSSRKRELLSVRREKMRLGGVDRYQWGGEDGESVRGLLTSKFRKAASGS